jgi:integrase
VITASPVARMKPLVRETSRDRALTDDEVRFFWSACDEIGWPFGPLFQLLLVTAQRRDEVGTMTFDELDLGRRLWVIPREKAKNDRAHEVALSDRALAIVAELKETRGRIAELKDCPLIFTTNGKTPVSGFSRVKERLDAKMNRLARRARGLPDDDAAYRKMFKLKGDQDPPRLIPEFILHDLRRTAATGMARLNIAPHVVDKVLNHSSGAIRGVAAVYNRFEYLNERRAALEAWGRYINNLLAPRTSVVELLRA